MTDFNDNLCMAVASVASADANMPLVRNLEPFMLQAEITTPRRIAAFIGQCSIESARFTVTSENLNYSALRLTQVWPARFPTIASAVPYDRNPEMIANLVYADRMGNGDAASGDGWTFRGAGYIQLTGRAEQTKFAAASDHPMWLGSVGDAPGNYLRTPKGAAESACWYWTENKLNTLADGWEITALSKCINGGTNGAQQRLDACNAALKALGGS